MRLKEDGRWHVVPCDQHGCAASRSRASAGVNVWVVAPSLLVIIGFNAVNAERIVKCFEFIFCILYRLVSFTCDCFQLEIT